MEVSSIDQFERLAKAFAAMIVDLRQLQNLFKEHQQLLKSNVVVAVETFLKEFCTFTDTEIKTSAVVDNDGKATLVFHRAVITMCREFLNQVKHIDDSSTVGFLNLFFLRFMRVEERVSACIVTLERRRPHTMELITAIAGSVFTHSSLPDLAPSSALPRVGIEAAVGSVVDAVRKIIENRNNETDDDWDMGSIERIEGPGHAFPREESSSFIWKLGYLTLNLKRECVLSEDFTLSEQTAKFDSGDRKGGSSAAEAKEELTTNMDLKMALFNNRNRLNGIFQTACQKETAIDLASNFQCDSILLLTFRIAISIARLPQFSFLKDDEDFNSFMNSVWIDLHNFDDHQLAEYCLFSSIEVAAKYAHSKRLEMDWNSFTEMLGENEIRNLELQNSIIKFNLWSYKLRLKLGIDSLFYAALPCYMAGSLYIVRTRSEDNHSQVKDSDFLNQACSYVWDMRNDFKGRGFNRESLEAMIQLLDRKHRSTGVSPPITFQLEYQDPHGTLECFHNYVKYIHEWAQEVEKPDAHGDLRPPLYASFFPLVQSSGSGKTRLIKEMISRMSVYYICLRPAVSSGRPPRSPVVADNLLLLSKNTDVNVETFYTAFFVRLLYRHLELLQKFNCNKQLKDQMERIFDTSCEGSTANTDVLTCEQFWESVFNRGNTFLKNRFSDLRDFLAAAKLNHDMVSQAVVSLLQLINENIEGNKELQEYFPVLVALDECSYLLPENSWNLAKSDESKTLFYSLRKATQKFKTVLVCVALDTNSTLWNLAPISSKDASSRVIERSRELAGPFFRLPFPWSLKLHKRLIHITDVVRGEEGCPSLAYNRFEMMLTSRPLFLGIQEQTGSTSLSDRWKIMAEFGTNKLLGLHDEKGAMSDSTCLSIFASRFPIISLDMETSLQMVAGNMATLMDVSEDRSYARVRFVSEPLVAESSARYMNSKDNFRNVLRHLTVLIRLGRVGVLFDRGDFGEFASSLILARAFDHAHNCWDVFPCVSSSSVSATSSSQMESAVSAAGTVVISDSDSIAVNKATNVMNLNTIIYPHSGAPATLRQFLLSLLGEERRSLIDDALMKTPSLKCGWVKFLQFIPCREKTSISLGLLTSAFRRHAALQTSHNFPGTDLIVPILLVSKGGDSAMSAMFVEVKNRMRKFTERERRTVVAKLLMASRRVVPEGPVVLVLMMLTPGDLSKGAVNRAKDRPTMGSTSYSVRGCSTKAKLDCGAVVRINCEEDKPEKGDYAEFDTWVSNICRGGNYVSKLAAAFCDVILITCTGCDENVYKSMSQEEFEYLRSISDSLTENRADVNNSWRKFGLQRNEIMKFISASTALEQQYYEELSEDETPNFSDTLQCTFVVPDRSTSDGRLRKRKRKRE